MILLRKVHPMILSNCVENFLVLIDYSKAFFWIFQLDHLSFLFFLQHPFHLFLFSLSLVDFLKIKALKKCYFCHLWLTNFVNGIFDLLWKNIHLIKHLFLTVAFTVDCQNTTKSIWKGFSPHPTRVKQEPIFASKFKCIKIKFLSSKVSFWSTWVFREDVFHSLIYAYNPILTHFFYRGLPLIHYREPPKEMARKCIKKGSHS